jgi:hypothetical protein
LFSGKFTIKKTLTNEEEEEGIFGFKKKKKI